MIKYHKQVEIMNKTLKIFKYIFMIVGATMFVGALYIAIKTSEFKETAITTNGTVIELLETKGSSNSITYKPLVLFTDMKGVEVRFSSSNSSNPPSYSVNEKVEVLYSPNNSQDAKIKTFFSIWGSVIILGILGITFFLFGGSIFLFDKRRANLLEHLKLNGTRIEADFQSVGENTSLKVNGRNPFQIILQWQNPATNKLHIFISDNIWFDPTHFIITDKIKVLIDRNNPKKYYVDLSFLPEVAD